MKRTLLEALYTLDIKTCHVARRDHPTPNRGQKKSWGAKNFGRRRESRDTKWGSPPSPQSHICTKSQETETPEAVESKSLSCCFSTFQALRNCNHHALALFVLKSLCLKTLFPWIWLWFPKLSLTFIWGAIRIKFSNFRFPDGDASHTTHPEASLQQILISVPTIRTMIVPKSPPENKRRTKLFWPPTHPLLSSHPNSQTVPSKARVNVAGYQPSLSCYHRNTFFSHLHLFDVIAPPSTHRGVGGFSHPCLAPKGPFFFTTPRV